MAKLKIKLDKKALEKFRKKTGKKVPLKKKPIKLKMKKTKKGWSRVFPRLMWITKLA